MPELPEVECLRRALAPVLIGARLERATLRRRDVLAKPASRSIPEALLHDGVITHLHRHGKQLALCAADGRSLVVQLGMSGQMLLGASAREMKQSTHVHALWMWKGPAASGVLAFRDPRRFGGLTACHNARALDDLWAELGPDALTITAARLAKALRGARSPRRQPIKALLLDQHRLAGVGNIYADEALFRARIAPHRSARDIRPDELPPLARCIRTVLRAAVRSGGSSIRDYRDPLGMPGAFQQSHLVYGRGGEPCPHCASRLSTATIAQRTTVWCPRCQS